VALYREVDIKDIMDKKKLSERDICTKFITPATLKTGWTHAQFREEVYFSDGRVIVRGNCTGSVQDA